MTDIFFSIVIPTYNRAHLIGKTIESVLAQTYPHFEIIVIDDGSEDNTEEIMRKYASPKLSYYKKENAERAAARNFGTRLAKGDYVNWVDSDDLLLPNHLDEASKMAAKNGIPEVFHLSFQVQDATNGRIKKGNDLPETVNSILYKGNLLSCNGVFVRRDIALDFPFNENRILSASEDYDLWMKLAARFPIYCSNTVTSLLIQHDERSMMSLDSEKIEERIELAWNNLWRDDLIMEKYGKHKTFMFAYKEAFLALHYSIAKKRKSALIKLISSIKTSPIMLKHKIVYATAKRIILK